EQEAQNIKVLETEFGKIVDELPKSSVTLREVSDDVPGAAEWNGEIRSARDTALSVLKPNGSDFDKTVEIAWKGSRYDSLEKRFLQLHSDYAELKSRFKEEDTSAPDFKGGTKPTSAPTETPVQKYRKALAAAQQSAEE